MQKTQAEVKASSYHVHSQNEACDNISNNTEYGTCQSEACFGNFNSHKINAHGVEDGFRATAEDGCHHAGEGVRAVGLKNIKNQTGSGRTGEHLNKNKTVQIGGKKIPARKFLY